MAKESSFDVVSEFDHQELVNALDQARRDIGNRFDLKDSGTEIELENDKVVVITTADEMKASNIYDIIESKIIKRGLSPLILDRQQAEDALGGRCRLKVNLKEGIDKDVAKDLVATIKSSKLKVQPSIQGEQIRVSGKDKDVLQDVIKLLKDEADRKALPLQFTNYR